MGFAGILRKWGLAFLVFCLIPVEAGATEFTAQMVLRQGDKTMPGKIYVKDGKMRQEFTDEQGETITIVRPDKKLTWILLPQERVYVELPTRARLPGQFLQVPPDAVGQRQVGKETVNGYDTDKLEVMVRGGSHGLMHQTFWVSQKLGTPVKMICKARNLCLEYRNIKETQVAERLFEVPPGYVRLMELSGRTLERWD